MGREDSKVVLITGCSSGIGRALARELAGRGDRCFATARREESVAELAAEGFEALRLDVNDGESLRAAVDAVMTAAGRIDMLVNNAGRSAFAPIAEMPLEYVEEIFTTNVMGPLAVIQAVVPHMAAHGRGCIVNVSSIVGSVPTPFGGAYCASKAALGSLSEVLRMEVEPLGIDVVVVEPASIRSEVANKSLRESERYAAESSLYTEVAESIEQRAKASQDSPMETDEFARRLADALEKPRPPRVVRIGAGMKSLLFLERLPGAQRDRLLGRHFGLDRLKKK
jgi:NAD(P)-dependent dehydrogenase (short-subunit alcohol dehydrogenase family)